MHAKIRTYIIYTIQNSGVYRYNVRRMYFFLKQIVYFQDNRTKNHCTDEPDEDSIRNKSKKYYVSKNILNISTYKPIAYWPQPIRLLHGPVFVGSDRMSPRFCSVSLCKKKITGSVQLVYLKNLFRFGLFINPCLQFSPSILWIHIINAGYWLVL